MTFLLKEPNLCPPDAKDWPEVKVRCGVMLLLELRLKFDIPHGELVDEVLFKHFDEKYRTMKKIRKRMLLQLAAKKLDEANYIDGDGGQGRNYTDDELLDALDLVEAQEYFLAHQWEMYKNRLRTPMAKKMSIHGKKARADKVHIHTTGACSFARKKDEYELLNKRKANVVESFELFHLTKKGSYVEDTSQVLMDRAKEEMSRKKNLAVDGSQPIDSEAEAQIAREVMAQLLGPDNPGRARGHGAGVTKSQVSQLSFDLRRMRNEASKGGSRFLLDKVHFQSKKIESQSKQIESLTKKNESQSKELESQSKKLECQSKLVETLSKKNEFQSKELESQGNQMKSMDQKMNFLIGELQLVKTAFPDLYSKCNTLSSTSHGDCH